MKIYLPRVRDAVAAAVGAEAPALVAVSGNETVLIVEDNAELRAVMVKQIGDLGYRTLEAEDAKTALAVLAQHRAVALLFSDIIMPGGMTGVELAREARRLYPTLRILLTSGYTARAMANGFHDIEGMELLNKPFRKRDLAQRIRQILDGC